MSTHTIVVHHFGSPNGLRRETKHHVTREQFLKWSEIHDAGGRVTLDWLMEDTVNICVDSPNVGDFISEVCCAAETDETIAKVLAEFDAAAFKQFEAEFGQTLFAPAPSGEIPDMQTNQAKFNLGKTVMTPGIQDLGIEEAIPTLLARHQSGDFGVLDDEDRAIQNASLELGTEPQRLMSVYAVNQGDGVGFGAPKIIWVVTEWDRSVTTLLLPSEY